MTGRRTTSTPSLPLLRALTLNLRLLLLILTLAQRFSPSALTLAAAAATTDADDGSDNSCGAASAAQHADPSSFSFSLYDHGGSAQAYKPSAPVKSTVCDLDAYAAPKSSGGESEDVAKKVRHRVARWPFSRSTESKSASSVRITGRLFSCSNASAVTNGGDGSEGNCPSLLGLANGDGAAKAAGATTTLEVWQARPDGTYSSLRPGIDEGDCRATVHPHTTSSDGAGASAATTFRIDTVAPGSTGALGGIGPQPLLFGGGGGARIDLPPYGPPAIHFLITADGHRPLLTQVEVAATPDYKFYGPDLRGPSLVGAGGGERGGRGGKGAPVRVRSVTGGGGDLDGGREISIEVDFYLTRQEEAEMEASFSSEGSAIRLEEALCPSRMYGLPQSFFTEPIAVCAPSMLDFFEL